MTKKELDLLRRSLLEEKVNIEAQLSRIAERNPDVEGDWKAKFKKNDAAESNDDRAQSITNYEERRAIEQSLEMQLRDVNLALKRLENGTYDQCVDCNLSIDSKRLKAIKLTHLCYKCASKRTNFT